MLSIAELAHKRDPKAIAEIICQELQPLDIDKLDVAVEIVDSSLELQIHTDSAIDKEKLLTLVHGKLQNLHVESVAKFKIHCWRNDQEMHEQRLLWTEQFMLDLPKSSPSNISDLEPDVANTRSPETRAPEPKLSKHSVLQQAISKIAPNHNQTQNHLPASNQEPSSSKRVSSSSLVLTNHHQQKTQSIGNYWQLVLVGLSIVLLGLGIGASVRAITSRGVVESSSVTPVVDLPIEDKVEKNLTTSTPASTQTREPSVVTSPAKPTASPSVEAIASSPDVQESEAVTLEKFNRIQKGMTIEQVEKVFGKSGQVIAENNSNDSIGKVYSWKNPQGSNAIIEFKDGQVVAKAQAGL
ncbi:MULTISPECIES: hypothetical protein [Pseudanabaena]|jgi:hypothetical protein|uniref:hypothetical protein n=1 Tax=Pseudanabaena TaxID=1152 RepID=UPI00247A4697|nr:MULTISPECIES: hypothetical protein [Pseudanabaena]MEA5485237.1 hypothetical protein [Pseudanabaena sp. CCNP1317]WGS72632.1 hypothetical protein OA858_01000 [Pseudanabaena galeata CCNP1313]